MRCVAVLRGIARRWPGATRVRRPRAMRAWPSPRIGSDRSPSWRNRRILARRSPILPSGMEHYGPERRSFPRPPLWLNLLLLIIAAATFAYARHHRDVVLSKSAILFQRSENNPADLNRMRDELAQADLTKADLAKETDGRMQYMQSLEGEQLYISIDSEKKKMQFRIGKDVVRETDVQIGEPQTFKTSGKTWTFYPLKGAFNVVDKDESYAT